MEVCVHGKTAQLPLIVIEGSGTPLFGRNWLEQIQLNWFEFIKINGITSQRQNSPQGLQTLLMKYKEVFQEELEQCKGVKAHLYVKADATPKCFRPRPIPLSMKEKVEADLDRKEKQGILEKIKVADRLDCTYNAGTQTGWNCTSLRRLQSNDKLLLGRKSVSVTQIGGAFRST